MTKKRNNVCGKLTRYVLNVMKLRSSISCQMFVGLQAIRLQITIDKQRLSTFAQFMEIMCVSEIQRNFFIAQIFYGHA